LGMSNFGMSGIFISLRSGTAISFKSGTLMAGDGDSSLAAFWRSTAARCFSFSAAFQNIIYRMSIFISKTIINCSNF
jgi:hypothetical protein